MSEKKPMTTESAPGDLSSILKDAPPGAWVALSSDKARIVATGRSINAASSKAKQKGETTPVLIRMPEIVAV